MYNVGVFITLIAACLGVAAAVISVLLMGFISGGSGAHDSSDLWLFLPGCWGILISGLIIYSTYLGFFSHTQTIGYTIIILALLGCLAGMLVAPCMLLAITGGTLCVFSGSKYEER